MYKYIIGLAYSMAKKFIIINRDKCIGCGACVVASNNKCDFIEGKAWCCQEEIDNTNEIIMVCPVDAISDTDKLDEYLEAKNKYDIKD